MKPTLFAICAGAGFALWSLVMSLTGLRGGGVVFMLLAGTLAITAPWFLVIRPEPFVVGHNPLVAMLVGFGAACLNGIAMVFLPPLLEAPPHIVGQRILIVNLTIVSVTIAWSLGFGAHTLTPSKICGFVLAVAAVWLLSR